MKKMFVMMVAVSVVAGVATAAPDAAKVFKKADANGDGKVCKGEFAAYKKAVLEKSLAKKELPAEEKAAKLAKLEKGQAKMFTKKDADGNGTLCAAEFSKAPAKKSKKAKDDAAKPECTKSAAKPACPSSAAKPACSKGAAKPSCGSCSKSSS